MAQQGPLNPTTVVDDAAIGNITWSNPASAKTEDGVFSTALLSSVLKLSHYLKATGFGFSIPSGATIDGIEVKIKRKSSIFNSIKDNQVRIVKGGVVGATDKSVIQAWSTTNLFQTYGSSSDLWGEAWTPADINAANFGCVVSATETSGSPTASVDAFQITVFYTSGATQISATGAGVATASATARLSATRISATGAGVATASATARLSATRISATGAGVATASATLTFVPTTAVNDEYIAVETSKSHVGGGLFKASVSGMIISVGVECFDKDKVSLGTRNFIGDNLTGIPTSWTRYSGIITGEGTAANQFAIGTKFVRFVYKIDYLNSPSGSVWAGALFFREAVGSADVDAKARWARIRTNLVTNPVFQFWSSTDVTASGWKRQPTGEFLQNTTKVRTGSSSLQFARLSSDPGTSQPGPVQTYNAGTDIGGQTANASAYFQRFLLAGVSAKVVLEALDSTGSVLATFNGNSVNSTTWSQSTTGNVTLPAGTFSARVSTWISENNFKKVFVDDFSLIINSVERIVNGGFETWSTVPILLDFLVPDGVTLAQSTDSASFGFSAELAGIDNAAGYSLGFVRDFKQDISGINFSVLLRAKIVAGNSITFQLQFQDNNGAELLTISAAPLSSTTYSTVAIAGEVAPANSEKVGLFLVGDSSTTFRADFVSLVPGDVPLDESIETGISLRAFELVIDSVQKAISVAQAAADAAKAAGDEIINLNGSSTPQSVAIDAQTLASDTQTSVGKVASDIKSVTGTVQSVG